MFPLLMFSHTENLMANRKYVHKCILQPKAENMNEPDERTLRIDVGSISPGPIRHKTLSPESLARISTIYELIGNYTGIGTLEEWEIGFMRDENPDSEISIWSRICLAWQKYHIVYLENRVRSKNYEERLVGALVELSTGVQPNEIGCVPASVAERLLACYKHPLPGEAVDGK